MSLNQFLKSTFSPQNLSSFGIVDWGYVQGSQPASYKHFKLMEKKGYFDPLDYLSGQRGKLREDIKNYFPKYQSAIVFLFSYAKAKKYIGNFKASRDESDLTMASFVLGFEGEDYHRVIEKRLESLAQTFKKQIGGLETKICLDIHPVLERDLAYRAGLGFFGKSSMLISKSYGSYFIIGSLLLSKKLDLEIKTPIGNLCGSCRACVEACPTSAIDEENKTVKIGKCVSTFTTELFGGKHSDRMPPEGLDNANGTMFGCDICQDVCPWNKKLLKKMDAPDSAEVANFKKSKLIIDFFLNRPRSVVVENLQKMSNREFARIFKDTSFERTGRVAILKTLNTYTF
ncbi:MAG: epoxyqueuosine reductase [Bacteriovoracaceae bacterium]|nr:epoxyqueuosine reductase [Bacteriovoracaceae bacterium]